MVLIAGLGDEAAGEFGRDGAIEAAGKFGREGGIGAGIEEVR